MTYPSRLGDRYTGLGAQTFAPKKDLSFLFFFFSSISTKVAINDFTMLRSAFNYFEMAEKTKMHKEEKKRER